MYASLRTLRLADGPDEVHNRTIARLEYGKYMAGDRNRKSETGNQKSEIGKPAN
jgi:hypothetical protein